jgi:Spx/MgsR family transcriptional regulator
VIKVYGIPNCNSVKKAFDWLKLNNLAYEFHDYKKKGVEEEKLKEWCAVFGWENLINKAGTTWKGLGEEDKNAVVDEASAVAILKSATSTIKRPIVESNGKYLMRFDEAKYAEALL